MSLDVHTIELPTGSTPSRKDRLIVGVQSAVANVAGGGAGLAVVTPVSFPNGNLPASYAVLITPNQDAVAFVTGKTATGFNVTLNPRLATNTLAAGTFDVLVVG